MTDQIESIDKNLAKLGTFLNILHEKKKKNPAAWEDLMEEEAKNYFKDLEN